MITGLRRPIRSETKPSSGQPMIQPNGTRRRAHHGLGVVESVRLLQVPHAPHHVEDRGGDEQQAGDDAAQDRLRVAEHQSQRTDRFPEPGRDSSRSRLAWQHEEEQGGDGEARRCPSRPRSGSRRTPAAIIGPTTNWPGGATSHAEHLRGADQRGGARLRGNWWWRCRPRPPARRRLPRPAGSAPRWRAVGSPEANSSAPMPTAAAPIGTTRRGPSRSIATPATRLNGE